MNYASRSDFLEGDQVELLDTEYNRRKGVAGSVGVARYVDHTLGLLVNVNNAWTYYFANQIEAKRV